MRRSAARPSGVERALSGEDLLVSKTDLEGRVSYANEALLRVSARTETELVGEPHSVLRHPDMPRAVYRLVWTTLADRREASAYLLNLAADGAHFWVVTHLSPAVDARGRLVGYSAEHRVATRRALERVEPLYRMLLAEERRHPRVPDAIDSSTAMLHKVLDGLGTTWDELVWSLSADRAAV